MGFNQVENAFLYDAMRRLELQYRRMVSQEGVDYGFPLPFRLNCNPLFMVVDGGKLTIAEKVITEKGGEELSPHPSFKPVPCYDRINQGEDLATAVSRVFCNGYAWDCPP